MSDLDLAPPAFNASTGETVAFVDLRDAHYTIDLSIPDREARVRSELDFSIRDEGVPTFDLGVMPTLLELDGQSRAVTLEPAPDGVTDYKTVAAVTPPGNHRLLVEHDLHAVPANPLVWQAGQVHCVLTMSDLDDGRFLARYLPSSLEYDHHPFSLRLNVHGARAPHTVVSNGRVTTIADNQFLIEFPSSFTPSFPWIHLAPRPALTFRHAIHRSIDGRDLRIGLYARSDTSSASHLDLFERVARTSVDALEAEFSPFPYSEIWIYGVGLAQGGMEYAGATSTNLHSVRHELDHSYFARCVAPANGDAGWIDEAIASWADAGYMRSSIPPARGSNMGRRSSYERTTSFDAYTLGRDLLAYIDHRFRDKGGLRPVLRRFFEAYAFRSTTTPLFKDFLEASLGEPLDTEFDEFVYGQSPFSLTESRELGEANPHHFSDIAQARRLLLPDPSEGT